MSMLPLPLASTVQQVCEWVGSLEGPLRDYRDAFERHAIDGKALLALNDSWLEKLVMESVVSSTLRNFDESSDDCPVTDRRRSAVSAPGPMALHCIASLHCHQPPHAAT